MPASGVESCWISTFSGDCSLGAVGAAVEGGVSDGAVEVGDGVIRVQVSATLPLVGLFGPTGAMAAQGRAIDEESW